MRAKDIKAMADTIEASLSVEVFIGGEVDIAESSEYQVLFEEGEVVGMVLDDEPYLSVRGLLRYRPERKQVTVDMGAVPYVINGADIMAPGIVDADLSIAPGDLVWIRDIKNRVPLAVGRALISGGDMAEGRSGKAVANIHYVGDKLWRYGED